MSDTNNAVGTVGWIDITVDGAEDLRDFYADVVGWKPEPVDMGEYADFNMTDPDSGEARAGVCHSRGGNADLPGCWMAYFTVEDLEASMARCVKRGGKLLTEPRSAGGRYCVIQDPSGAVCAIFQPAS